MFMAVVRTFALCVSHAFGEPLSPRKAGSRVPTLLKAAVQTLLSIGFKGAWQTAPLHSQIGVMCPFRAASTVFIVRCITAGVAEKKSSFPFKCCSSLRVVRLAFFSPSSCILSTHRLARGLVVAPLRGPTWMIASSTVLSFSTCLSRAATHLML